MSGVEHLLSGSTEVAMLKTAVIGVGAIGSNHARVLSELAETQFVAVADQNPQTAQAVARRWGVRAYQDYREMLSIEQPDAVIVAVPTADHEEIVVSALEMGSHTLVEKPIANTIEAGQRIIATAQHCKRLLMVGHILRFNPAIQQLKQRLENGQLGKIFQMCARRTGPFPTRIQDVGVAIDLAPHDLDVMRYITGLDPHRLYAEVEHRLHTDHEDLLLCLLRFPENINASLEINWLTPTKVRELLVLGERGLFRVDDLTQDLYFYENADADSVLWPEMQTLRGVREGSMVRYVFPRFEPLKAELKAFIHAIREGAPPPVSGEDGLVALHLALLLLQSGMDHQVKDITYENCFIS
jgi:UDP-N-acetylglucosamine 3-dehydrogenase